MMSCNVTSLGSSLPIDLQQGTHVRRAGRQLVQTAQHGQAAEPQLRKLCKRVPESKLLGQLLALSIGQLTDGGRAWREPNQRVGGGGSGCAAEAAGRQARGDGTVCVAGP